MTFQISEKLRDLYHNQSKNYEYAIDQIMNSFDPESFVECFRIVNGFDTIGDKCEINISDSLVDNMIKDLGLEHLDHKTVELVLWLGAVFPEV